MGRRRSERATPGEARDRVGLVTGGVGATVEKLGEAWGAVAERLSDGQAVGVAHRSEHWECVYAATPSTGVSWYEREPAMSIRLIEANEAGSSAAVVDVGAGASVLVDHLVVLGYDDVTVLDISRRALDDVRQRLGERCEGVVFVQHDVLRWEPSRLYDVWHDRAAFHFLTERNDRDRYVEVVARAVRVGGSAVFATFAEDGPTQCSGLPVVRYSAEMLAEVFSAHFSLATEDREEHVTPAGVAQPLTWVVLRRE